jgi:integrase
VKPTTKGPSQRQPATDSAGGRSARYTLAAVEIDPVRRIYDLRHTFATFALRAGISTLDLSRYMGASPSMINRHYGHLARDGRQRALDLLDAHMDDGDVHAVDARWTPNGTPEPQSLSENHV